MQLSWRYLCQEAAFRFRRCELALVLLGTKLLRLKVTVCVLRSRLNSQAIST